MPLPIPYCWEGFSVQRDVQRGQSARIAVRLSIELPSKINEAAKTRGYASPSAFIRAAILNELNGRAELIGTEDRIAGGFDRVLRDIFRVSRGQQALFAFVDSLIKTILTCTPEPPADAMPQAVARAKQRYDRLVKAAGQAMSGDALAAMKDLISNGTN
jgi:hypothetical protein